MIFFYNLIFRFRGHLKPQILVLLGQRGFENWLLCINAKRVLFSNDEDEEVSNLASFTGAEQKCLEFEAL